MDNEENRKLSVSKAENPKALDSDFFETSVASTDSSEDNMMQAASDIDNGIAEQSDDAYEFVNPKKNNKASGKKKKTNFKKKHIKIRVIVGTIAGLVGAIVGIVCFAMWYKDYLLNKITYETTASDAVITIIDESGNTVALSNVTHTTRFEPIKDEPIKNFLLIGIDSRSKYYNDSGLGDRSDVIVVMSIDSKHGTIKLLSIARDSYAFFPGYSTPHKINAAMSYGGPELLEATVESVLRIEIDGYAYVNFNHMADIVDSVGGVYVHMTAGEMNIANDYIRQMDPYAEPIYNTGDDTWLNGIQAVAYARIRYVGNGDFERMERQIEVLRSVMDQFMKMSALEKMSCMDDVFEAIVTNIDKQDIEKYALEFLPSLQNAEMQYLQLPIEGCYNAGMYGDEWSERVNWNALIPYVQLYFYGKTADFDEVDLPNYAPDIDYCATDIPLEELIH